MDKYFYENDICYARYSDDVIIFDEENKLKTHIETYRKYIKDKKMIVNSDKEQIIAPGETWSFIGFEYRDGKIDIAHAAIRKLMGKIRRSARSIRRWCIKKNVPFEKGLMVFNRKFNKKFYCKDPSRDLCWTKWYFPLINTTKGIHAIDLYMQQYQRYLVTGKQKKSSYEVAPYELLKENGYKPLVHEYYKRWDEQ